MSFGKLNTHWHRFWDCLVANLDPGWFVWSFWNTNLRHPSLELLRSLSDLWCYTPWPWSSLSLRASDFSSPLSLSEPRLASSHLWAWPGVPSHALHLAYPSSSSSLDSSLSCLLFSGRVPTPPGRELLERRQVPSFAALSTSSLHLWVFIQQMVPKFFGGVICMS